MSRSLPPLREILNRTNSLKIAASCIGILFLVPAMVVVGLYPTSWGLDVISFQIGSMKIADFRWLIVILIAAASALFFLPGRRQQGPGATAGADAPWRRLPNVWLILALLASGLLLLPVDRMGMGTPGTTAAPSEATTWGGYPGDYDSGDARKRLKKIERPETVDDRLGFMRRLYDLIYPRPLPTDRAKSLIGLADLAVDRFKKPNDGEVLKRIEARSVLVGHDMHENGRMAALCLSPRWTEMSYWTETGPDCARTVKQRFNESNSEFTFLTELKATGAPAKKFELASTATAAVKVELDTLERQMEERISFVGSVPYLVAASVAFMLAMYVVGFRSWAMAFLIVATVFATGWSVWPIAWSECADYVIVLYPACVGVLAGFLWRFLFRAYLDNKEILRAFRLSKRLLAGFVVRVLIAAIPFYGLIYLAHSVSQAVYDELSAVIYCESSSFDCGSARRLVYDSDPTRDTLRDDVNAGVQRLFLEFEARAVNAAASAPTEADKALHQVIARVMASFDDALPANLYDKFPDLKPPGSCWGFLLQVGRFVQCFARKIALERLNAAYQAPRNQLRENLRRALNDLAAQIRTGVTVGSAEIKASIQGQANVAARYATRTVDASFIGLSALAIAQMAFALLVVMRALLLLAGRTLYGESRPQPTGAARRRPESPARTGQPLLAWLTPLRWPAIDQRLRRVSFPLTHTEAKANVSPTVRIKHEEYELLGDRDLPLLVKRKYDVDDAYKATALVRSRYHQWALRRLMNGCLILRWAWREEGKDAIRLSGPAGSRLVVWHIPEGCEVFFRWNEFVAVSASAKLKKTYSLRLGSLMTGTVMLPSVVGPGILIQVNRGITELAKIETVPPSIYPHRLISWEAGTDFRIRSPRGILSLYCDPPSLEPAKGALAIIDTDGGSSRGVGLLKELFRLVRP